MTYKDAFDFGLDLNAEQFIEVQYQFDFKTRKSEELKRTIMHFSNDGKVVYEEIHKDNKLVEQSKFIYDAEGRLSEIQSDLIKEYKYVHQGDTLTITETSEIDVKVYQCIYKGDLLDHIIFNLDGKLMSKEEIQYSGGKIDRKKVQYFRSDGKRGTSETHKYKNGRTVFFSKRNSGTDDKSCHYYFNAIDGSLDFEETARPGMDAVISKDCNYIYEKEYWVGKSEEHFSIPISAANLSSKQKHLFYFRKIMLKDGTKIGNIRVQKDFVDRYVE